MKKALQSVFILTVLLSTTGCVSVKPQIDEALPDEAEYLSQVRNVSKAIGLYEVESMTDEGLIELGASVCTMVKSVVNMGYTAEDALAYLMDGAESKAASDLATVVLPAHALLCPENNKHIQ